MAHPRSWLREPTRFAAWPRWLAVTLLALLALVTLYGIAIERTSINAEAGTPAAGSANGGTDKLLYERIVGEMRTGTPYYVAAAPALREGDYPLKPFVAFRLPTLAALLASLPPVVSRALMLALVAATLLAWTISLLPAFTRPATGAVACLLLVCGVAVALQPAMIVFHEIWASLLIALSLALRRDDRWWPSVIVGLCAVLIRETALPYILAMVGFALLERRWREMAAWSGVAVLFGLALALHAAQVATVVLPGDPVSPGWAAMGGWRFFISAMRLTTPLTLMPLWVSALAVPLALLGWASWRTPWALRTLAILCGYALMLTLFGRPDNFYWGLLIAPLLLVGLAFAPIALRDLLRGAFGSASHLDRQAVAGH